jgi:hypothetical protein
MSVVEQQGRFKLSGLFGLTIKPVAFEACKNGVLDFISIW